jgi:transcriptional regulator with XRE-family HTH domain
VLGRNARTLRQNAHATLEDVATAVGSYGLAWSTGSVGSLESGRTVGVNLENLLIVAAALGDIIGRPVRLAELFDGDGDVTINDELSVPLQDVVQVLSGAAASIPAGVIEIAGARVKVGKMKVKQTLPPSALRETDLKVCKSLGVDPLTGAKAMVKLWRASFTTERDRLAGPGANPQKRGRVSRQLKAQLRQELSRGHR